MKRKTLKELGTPTAQAAELAESIQYYKISDARKHGRIVAAHDSPNNQYTSVHLQICFR